MSALEPTRTIDWREAVLAVLLELKTRKGIGYVLQKLEHDDPKAWEELVDDCVISASEAAS